MPLNYIYDQINQKEALSDCHYTQQTHFIFTQDAEINHYRAKKIKLAQ